MSAPSRPDSYAGAWLAVLAALALGVAAWRSTSGWRLGPQAPEAWPRGSKTWFLALRMPEIKTDREAGVEAMRRRYDDWLRALRRAGFCPLTLSQAREGLLAPGRGLPDRAVVCLFQPGRRRTLAIVDPIFRREGWPAAWFTDTSAMREGNRDYVTFHLARRMAASGWWDVAYSRRDGGYDVVSRNGRFMLGGGGLRPWSAIDGTFAFNRAAPSAELESLTVNPNWTADELVDRLRAELPVERPTCLEKATVQRKEWGITGRPTAHGLDCPAFSLAAPPDKRGARLFWLGTSRAGRFRVSLTAQSLVGELQLRLRADEGADREITVAFAPGKTVISRRSGAQKKRLTVLDRGAGLAIRIELSHDRLTVTQPGAPAWTSPPLSIPDEGILELSVLESVRGVARADGLRVAFEPLPPDSVVAER